jgi:hypothetical protein
MRAHTLAIAVALLLPGCNTLGGFQLSVENKTPQPASGVLRLLLPDSEEVVTEFSFSVSPRSEENIAKPKERGSFVLLVLLEDGRSARHNVSLSDDFRGLHVIITEDAILAAPRID